MGDACIEGCKSKYLRFWMKDLNPNNKLTERQIYNPSSEAKSYFVNRGIFGGFSCISCTVRYSNFASLSHFLEFYPCPALLRVMWCRKRQKRSFHFSRLVRIFWAKAKNAIFKSYFKYVYLRPGLTDFLQNFHDYSSVLQWKNTKIGAIFLSNCGYQILYKICVKKNYWQKFKFV